MRFRRDQHLRRSNDFEQVRQKGSRATCGVFSLQLYSKTDTTETRRRVGVIASKRVGNAIARNRCKRLMREVFRNNQEILPENSDLVMIARAELLESDFETLNRRFIGAIRKLTLSKKNEG